MWLAIVVLSVVEGLTEFLPISSTGHLVVGASLLRFDPAWREPFLVVIQLGAILAVVYDRAPQLRRLFTRGREVFVSATVKLAVGFLPSAVLGLLLHDAISDLLRSPVGVSAAWIVGGVLIFALDRRPPSAELPPPPEDDLDVVTVRQAFLVGLTQCLALWPGMSRSGSTILGGLFFGLDRRSATLFSFYLAIPTMFAASGYELLKFRHALDGSGPAFALGMAVSFVVALVTVRWLLRYVQTHTFRPFAIYRIVAGALLLLLPASLWSE